MEKPRPNFQLVKLHHTIKKAEACFSLYSPHIPRALIEIQQHIHGQLDQALYYADKAANEPLADVSKKVLYIDFCTNELMFVFSRLESLVINKGLTPGSAGEVSKIIKEAVNQCDAWKNKMLKSEKFDTIEG